MKIIIFTTDDFLYPAGGAEVAIGEITKRLPHIEFDLICAKLRKKSSRYEKVGNVEIHRIGFGIPRLDGYLLALLGYFKAMSLHRIKKYDLVWPVMASYGAFSAVRFKKKARLPMLLTLQEGDDIKYIEKSVRFVKRAFANIFKSADGLQSISWFLKRWGEDMGFSGLISRVIPNGVDIRRFSKKSDKNEIKKIRESFGFAEDSFVLITVSRLVIKNGVVDIINALKYLPKKVSLVICGDGPLEKKLKNQVANLGLKERVCFLGFVKNNSVPSLLKASDLFIRPSLSEGLGIAFLEAMVARILVVGTLVGGIVDFLDDGQTGFAVKPNNPQSIKKTLDRILSMSREDRESVAETAFNMVKDNYNWDFIATDMESVFKKLVYSRNDI